MAALCLINLRDVVISQKCVFSIRTLKSDQRKPILFPTYGIVVVAHIVLLTVTDGRAPLGPISVMFRSQVPDGDLRPERW